VRICCLAFRLASDKMQRRREQQVLLCVWGGGRGLSGNGLLGCWWVSLTRARTHVSVCAGRYGCIHAHARALMRSESEREREGGREGGGGGERESEEK
jgi:hypothetical protein